jgi:hypothetical protein
MRQNYITLPRSKLYEMVWSKPVTELAKQFGISDVALAKRCRALRIPLPHRGYWAKVAAGQRPRRPPLPPFAVERTRASTPSYVTTRGADGEPTSEPAIQFDPDRAADKLGTDDRDLPTVTVPASTDLANTLAIVKRTARHYKHARRAELELKRGEATGPILCLDVSPEALERALLFSDTFLKAAAELNWTPIPPREPERPGPRHYYGRPPEPPKRTGPDYADLDVNGHRIEFRIEERFEERELPPTEADLRRQKRDSWFRPEKRSEKIWSGRLRVKRARPGYRYHIDGKSWFETASRTLDDLIPRILADFRAVAARMQEVDEREERERLERERLARLAAELAARRTANEKLIHSLEAQAGAWHRAQFLRRYLRAARRALGPEGITARRSSDEIDFLGWAEHYVNQLDPLHPEPRDPDYVHERDPYYSSEDKRPQESLQRLIGFGWENTAKLRACPDGALEYQEEDADEDAYDDDWM